MRLMNSSKNKLNSSKNKLNDKRNSLFKPMPNTTLGISHDLYQSKRYIYLLTRSRFIVIASYIVKMLLLSALCLCCGCFHSS